MLNADFDAITATSYGGIIEADLVGKNDTETIPAEWTHSGDITFDNAVDIQERASADTDKAGDGQDWVRDDVTQTRFFTDDTGRDFAFAGELGGSPVYKTVTTPRDTTDTLADDPHLVITGLKNDQMYRFTAWIAVACASTTPEFKWDFDFSQTLQAFLYDYQSTTESGTIEGDIINAVATFVVIDMDGTNDRVIRISGSFHTNVTTGGDIAFRWAQGTSNGTSVDVLLGSWMAVQEMGNA